MNRLLASSALALLLTSGAALAANEPNVESGGDAQACRAEISKLRMQIGGEGSLKEGDHELLAGLSAEEAGEPQESWFGSPPEKEATLQKLDDAAELAADGDAEGCHAMVEEVQQAVSDSAKRGDDKSKTGG